MICCHEDLYIPRSSHTVHHLCGIERQGCQGAGHSQQHQLEVTQSKVSCSADAVPSASAYNLHPNTSGPTAPTPTPVRATCSTCTSSIRSTARISPSSTRLCAGTGPGSRWFGLGLEILRVWFEFGGLAGGGELPQKLLYNEKMISKNSQVDDQKDSLAGSDRPSKKW